jgi:hypothetical protein
VPSTRHTHAYVVARTRQVDAQCPPVLLADAPHGGWPGRTSAATASLAWPRVASLSANTNATKSSHTDDARKRCSCAGVVIARAAGRYCVDSSTSPAEAAVASLVLLSASIPLPAAACCVESPVLAQM